MSIWLRRNRLALILLPVAMIAALVGSSSRVQEYWWNRGMHEGASPDARGVVQIADEYDDGFLRYPIEAGISLTSVEPVTSLPGASAPAELPTGAMLWRVVLHWDADPDVSLTGCEVAIMDQDGTRYVADALDFDANASIPIYSCVPEGAPGPKPRPGSAEQPAIATGDPQRPREFDTDVYVVTPVDTEPRSVRVWWFLPKYADLPVG